MTIAANDPPSGLSIYVIYEKPSGYPQSYVARHFLNDHPTDYFCVGYDLELVRNWVKKQFRHAPYCMPRKPNDDPAILEVWL